MTELIKLPDSTKEFTARWTDEESGIEQSETFYIEDTLSLERFMMFERFRMELGFGISFMDMVKAIQSNLDLVERAFHGEKTMTQLVVANSNLLKGINDTAKKEPFAYWLCTLFMNTKDEDRRYYKEEVMRRKLRIWYYAGYDVNFFLSQALALVTGFLRISSEITQMSLEENQMISAEHDSSDQSQNLTN